MQIAALSRWITTVRRSGAIATLSGPGECKRFMTDYLACLKTSRGDNKPCRIHSKRYLACRMDRSVDAADRAPLIGAAGSWRRTIGQTWAMPTFEIWRTRIRIGIGAYRTFRRGRRRSRRLHRRTSTQARDARSDGRSMRPVQRHGCHSGSACPGLRPGGPLCDWSRWPTALVCGCCASQQGPHLGTGMTTTSRAGRSGGARGGATLTRTNSVRSRAAQPSHGPPHSLTSTGVSRAAPRPLPHQTLTAPPPAHFRRDGLRLYAPPAI